VRLEAPGRPEGQVVKRKPGGWSWAELGPSLVVKASVKWQISTEME